jgi:hypothetical protein
MLPLTARPRRGQLQHCSVCGCFLYVGLTFFWVPDATFFFKHIDLCICKMEKPRAPRFNQGEYRREVILLNNNLNAEKYIQRHGAAQARTAKEGGEQERAP